MSSKILVLCGLCVLAYFIQASDSAPSSVVTCEIDGKTYHDGDHFNIDCNSCICGINGRHACTQKICETRRKRGYNDCMFKGKPLWNKNSVRDGCRMCKCWFSKVTCTKKFC